MFFIFVTSEARCPESLFTVIVNVSIMCVRIPVDISYPVRRKYFVGHL